MADGDAGDDRREAATPRVYTIPPTARFLDVVADALVSGRLVPGGALEADPLALADAVIYVPTRRAGRALGEALVDRLGGRAAILPSIRPLGDVEEDLIALDGHAGDGADVDPAADLLGRRLAMTELVLGWARHLSGDTRLLIPGDVIAVPTSPADSARLADDLLGLMDQVTTEEVSWDALTTLVPDDLARFWQITLHFLSIATHAWPAILAERGLSDPAKRRVALIRAEARRLAIAPPRGPVIVAGSTGSVPAAAGLMAVIARLPRGAVVLPGLDPSLDAVSWAALGGAADTPGSPSHPQYGLARLIARLGIGREDVVALAEPPSAALDLRTRLVGEAFRPAETTEAWADLADRLGGPSALTAALEGVSVVEAANDREEALAIALVLREAVEAGATTAALVTPDRAIARRVQSELQRWGIRVDDSAGLPLAQTPDGILARLIAEAALDGEDPRTILALLKHPLARFGRSAGRARRDAERLERDLLRGPRLAAGIAPLVRAAEAAVPRLAPFLRRVETILAPLLAIAEAGDPVGVATLARAHRAVIAAVQAGDPEEEPRAPSRAASALDAALERLSADDADGFAIRPADWPALFVALVGDTPIRPPGSGDGRIHVWGVLEARLQPADLIVLAGLNESVWPQTANTDPWLTRSMRAGLGLDPPERRIGLSAHDVAQALGAPRVVLSRAERIGTSPTVASRWLQRLKAVTGAEAWRTATARGETWLALARRLDRPEAPPRPAPRPNPKPPVAARPDRLRITEIETLIRDPYAVYARRVLRLEPLDPIAADPGGLERGTMIHDALATFFARWNGPLNNGAVAALLAEGRRAFAAIAAFPEVMALWWPRFERVARALVALETEEKAPARRHLEIAGELELEMRDRSVRLIGRADRIDEHADGRLAVLDYKTGAAPSPSQVTALLAPQLPLEAAMARLGGFPGVPSMKEVALLRYVLARGGEPAVAFVDIAPEETTPNDLADEAMRRLSALLARYEEPDQGYLSRAWVAFERARTGDYDHLARVAEWSAGGDEP